MQPVAFVKVMVAAAEVSPVTNPVRLPTEATEGFELLQVPDPEGSENVMADPRQTVAAPEIAAGNAATVTGREVAQPVGSVYVIVSVPGEIPVSNPGPVKDPTALLLLVQVPLPASV